MHSLTGFLTVMADYCICCLEDHLNLRRASDSLMHKLGPLVTRHKSLPHDLQDNMEVLQLYMGIDTLALLALAAICCSWETQRVLCHCEPEIRFNQITFTFVLLTLLLTFLLLLFSFFLFFCLLKKANIHKTIATMIPVNRDAVQNKHNVTIP